MDKDKNLALLDETLRIIETGNYTISGKTVSLQLTQAQMRDALVFTDRQIRELVDNPPDAGQNFPFRLGGGRCYFSVKNIDTFAAAVNLYKNIQECERLQADWGWKNSIQTDEKILVLNFASPVNPGGGVRAGAKAQEEDLCRKSTLLASLESAAAQEMYRYNRGHRTFLSSDYMILSPQVEVFRNARNKLLEETAVVSVLTAAAPNISKGLFGTSLEKLEDVIYKRIMGILQLAATHRYTHLVLGAWGCGAFGNDADMVARLFYQAFKDIRCGKILNLNALFKRVDFAVLDQSEQKGNFNCFSKYFEDFFRDEKDAEKQTIFDKTKENEKGLDAIRGCLIGGAAGDALGYPVEFLSLDDIRSRYGNEGITEYLIDGESGKALISDDTQMTLFTANGILVGATRAAMRGIAGSVESYVHSAYLDWLSTQTGKQPRGGSKSWLTEVDELHAKRAPGLTCLRALRSGDSGTIGEPINDSKGCGGVMRVAPVALYYRQSNPPALLSAKVAALTHGHPLGYMPAAALVQIISRIVYGGCSTGDTIYDIVEECRDVLKELFAGEGYLGDLLDIIELAVSLSRNVEPDTQNIARLGEGWVAEEALAIALYCSLKYYNDFSKAIIAAVNHGGDSDSTGAITGNIVGAHIGYSNISQKWKAALELHDTILEIADDLCHDCQMSEYDEYRDEEWAKKYLKGVRRYAADLDSK